MSYDLIRETKKSQQRNSNNKKLLTNLATERLLLDERLHDIHKVSKLLPHKLLNNCKQKKVPLKQRILADIQTK